MGLRFGRLPLFAGGEGTRASLTCRETAPLQQDFGGPEVGQGRASGAEVRLPWDARGSWGLRHRGTVGFPGAMVAPRVREVGQYGV